MDNYGKNGDSLWNSTTDKIIVSSNGRKKTIGKEIPSILLWIVTIIRASKPILVKILKVNQILMEICQILIKI